MCGRDTTDAAIRAAGLYAGKPTGIVAFFGDQFFWGALIEKKKLGFMIPFSGELHQAVRMRHQPDNNGTQSSKRRTSRKC